MTEIGRLQELLDECGVKWFCNDDGMTTWGSSTPTSVALHSAFGEDDGIFLTSRSVGLSAEQALEAALGKPVNGSTSDGYHTFDELYHHRAVLFSVIVRDHRRHAWKSRLHADGTMFDGMFIVGIETPSGQATYHYDIDPYWALFECVELERAPEWDGHTPEQAIERISTIRPDDEAPVFQCPHCGLERADGWCPKRGGRLIPEMSNFFLCDMCAQHHWTADEGAFFCEENPSAMTKRVMFDYGSERGHMQPYDNPLDVCEHFKQKEVDE